MKRFVPYILVLAAATCWGFMGMFNRNLTALGFSQTQLFFCRVLIPAVLLGLWLAVFDRKAFRIRLRDLWMFLGEGLVSLTAFGLAYFYAMQLMPLSVAAVLLYTSPAFVLVMSAVLFRERITAQKVVALVLVLAGAICATGMLTGSGSAIPLAGVGLGLLSGFCYALYSIFGRYALNAGYKSTTISFYAFLFATIALGFVADVSAIPALLTSGKAWFWTLMVGPVTCLIPYVLYLKGMAGMQTGTASILASWEMIVANIISVAVFHEAFGWANLVGVILVAAGIVVMNIRGLGPAGRKD